MNSGANATPPSKSGAGAHWAFAGRTHGLRVADGAHALAARRIAPLAALTIDRAPNDMKMTPKSRVAATPSVSVASAGNPNEIHSVHGLTVLTPAARKGPSSRVATASLFAAAIAAICPSACEIGAP